MASRSYVDDASAMPRLLENYPIDELSKQSVKG